MESPGILFVLFCFLSDKLYEPWIAVIREWYRYGYSVTYAGPSANPIWGPLYGKQNKEKEIK